MYRYRTFTAPVHPFINNISEGDIKGFVFQLKSNLLVQRRSF
jgi:hypothetical protein